MLCAGLGFLVPFVAFEGPATTYEASLQLLVVGSGDSGSVSSATETVAAIANDIADHRADVRPEKFVRSVTIEPIGNSGIVMLSVVDEDPVVASAVANSLAGQVVRLITNSADRDRLISDYTRQIDDINKELDLLAERVAADPTLAPSLDPQREFLLQTRAGLQTALANRETVLAARPVPSILGEATPDAARLLPSSRPQDLAFGALLGLVVGIAAAALAEALNPTLVGRESISAETRAPVLGVLPDLSGAPSDELSWLGWQLAVQAKRTKVATLELTTAGPDADLSPLSEALTTAIATQRGGPSRRARRAKATVGGAATALSPDPALSPGSTAATTPAGPTIRVQVLDRANLTPVTQNGSAGLVIVTPTVVKRAETDPAMDLLQVTGWPLVGAIAYRKRGIVRSLWRLVHRPRRTSEPSREVIDVP